ncbi:C4-dicarboxylate TRAP transporter substrate-binding protein [Alteribacillus sp. JSM 102045]|uniref:C4-dicarboxylate TRAP transporter substrate-binding protein n=1 Tax=Alteribacillus sp. JSM 102045 TaxID=1562101 RepID=UPI0035C0BE88
MNVKIKGLSILLCLMSFSMIIAACGNNTSTKNAESANEEVISLQVGSAYSPQLPWTNSLKNFFIPEVNKALQDTNYKINWTENYSGTVAKAGEELGAVKNGLLDIAFVVSPFEVSALPISNIGYNVPFSSGDPVVVSKAINALNEKYPELSEEYNKANQKLLGLGTTEDYAIQTKFPVKSFNDLKGETIAAVGSNIKWIEPLGVTPVQAALAEMYQSLQSGVYKGVVAAPTSVTGTKLYEQAEYFTEIGFGCAVIGGLTINQDTFDNLPSEVQEVIVEVGVQFPLAMAELSNNETDEALKEIEDGGGTLSTLPNEERKKIAKLLSDIPNSYAEELNKKGLPGSEIMKDYIQLQIDEGHVFPVDYQIN